MKYNIDRELKNLAGYRGSAVIYLYPLLNIAYGLNSCRSDNRVTVRRFSVPGYNGAELKSLVIDPKQIQYASPMEADSLAHFPKTYVETAEFDCLHDEGVAFAKRLKSEGVTAELHEVKGACHGFEAALKSTIVADAINRRIKWIKSVFA